MTAMAKPDAVATNVARHLGEFRTAINESFVPLQVSSDHPDRFRGVIRATSVDDVHITEVRATDHVVERTPGLIARGDRPYFKVSLMLAGSGLLVQGNREAMLRPGDLAVYDTGRPYSLAFDSDFRSLVVMFPRNSLAIPADLVAELTAVRIAGDTGPAPIVAAFLGQIAANLEQVSGPTGSRLAHSALDLVTTLVSGELGLDGGRLDPHRELMHRIRGHIDKRLSSPELTPASIAAAHFISTRHLHGLFQQEGTTVSTWIRERRLAQCRRDLADPLLADRPVAAIATRAGFVDAAHFSRTFKAAYGIAPSEYRASR